MGESGGKQIHEMIASADRPGGGTIATIASFAGLIFGATGAFMQLQGALNRAWEVKPDPEQGGVMVFITKRLLSGGMVLGIGFLLAVSLALTAGISAVGGAVGGGIPEPLLHGVTFVVSFLVLGALFAAMYKILPDAEIEWRDVRVGAAVTALLFVAGKFAIGLYLGRSSPGDAFGAAGALAVVLIWAYYSGMILLFCAEFTQQWARERGSGIRPEKGAVQVVEHEEIVSRGGPKGKGGGKSRDGRSRNGAGASRGGRTGPSRTGGPRAVASAHAEPDASGGGKLRKTLLGVPVLMFFFRKKGEAHGAE
jgi:membrane protein